MIRNVYIRHEPQQHGLLIVYADRQPRTRKLYAQFDDRVKSLDEVIAYVRENVLLRLVCPISGNHIA